MTSVALYSVLSLFGFCLIATNLRAPLVWLSGVFLLAIAPSILVHGPMDWVVLVVKLFSAFAIALAAAVWPRTVLRCTAVFLILDACLELLVTGPSKSDALPTFGMVLMAASFWDRRAIFFSILALCAGMSAINITAFEYRSELVLFLMILAMLMFSWLGLLRFGVYFLLFPIVVAVTLSLIGGIFSNGLNIIDLGLLAIAPTASNVERSLMSFFALGNLVSEPLGWSFVAFSSETFAAATAHGRQLYSSSALDPHNFFSFFAVSFGMVGCGLFVAGTLGMIHALSRTRKSARELVCVLVPIIAVVSSFFPFATEYRLVWTVACGSLLGAVINVRLRPFLGETFFLA
jgi:hypothetical protein